MSASSVVSSGTLVKPKRENVTREYAESIKPWLPSDAQIEAEGDNLQYHIRYVAAGVEKIVECDRPLWRQVTGPMPKAGRLPPGYDNKVNHDFVILLDKKNPRRAVGVDQIPKHDPKHGLVPGKRLEHASLTIKVNPKRGSMEVIEVPPKILNAHVRRVMSEMDARDQISIGDKFANCEVIGIAGDQVSLRASRTDEDDDED